MSALQTAAPEPAADHGAAIVALARKLRLDDRLDEAEEALKALLVDEPPDHGGWLEHGACRRRRGDLDGALASFSRAAAAMPAHLGTKVEIASTLRALDRLPEAVEVLNAVLEADPRRTEALIERGHLARRQGDHEAALAAFEAAGRNHPDHLGIGLETVRSLRQLGRLDAAAAKLEELLREHPRDVGVLIEKGHVARRRGDDDGALAAFKAAGELAPGHDGIRQEVASTLVALATAAWNAGDPAHSSALLDEALTCQPTHAAALLTRAEQALKADDPETAIRYARRAVDAHPRHLEALLLGARAASAIPDRRQALQFLDEAEERFGARAEVLASRIHVLRALGDNAGAGEVIARAGDLATHPSLWAEIASWRIAAGDFDGAAGILDRLPPSPDAEAHAIFFRAAIAEARRDYDAALATYEKALAYEPENGIWHAEAARAALLALDVDGARSHLQKAMVLNAAASISRGQSLNPSQHHTGQLIDEFALDRDALGELRAAKALDLSERLAALRDIVRRYPDNTAAATMLLLALQRSGALRGERDGGAFPIPRRIAQFWDRPDPPADVRSLMASWSGETGFAYHLFDERTAETFLRRNAGRDVARAFRRAGHAAQRADIFRLAWLAKEGGLYADADDRRLAPLANLVPEGADLVVYQENYGSIANNFLAAAPAHPVILRALDLAAVALNRGDKDFVWLSTGPGLMTRAMAQVLAEDEDGAIGAGILARELHEMRRLVEIHCPVDYKSTRAHWSRAVFARLKPRTSRPGEESPSDRDPA
jgi:tetratricopeptide (TPR) repeat protein